MAIETNEIYTYLSTQVRPQLESLTRAVLAARDKMQTIEQMSNAAMTPAEVSEKLNELKEALIAGDVGAGNANRLDGKTITEIMEQIERQVKATLNPADLLDDESDGNASKTYSSAKIKELLALNVEIDDSASRDDATYSSKKIEQEIAKAALGEEAEQKILELVNAMATIQTTVQQLVSTLRVAGVSEQRVNELIAAEIAKSPSTAGVSEERVNELIGAANLTSGGVDEERLKELIATEIAKSPSAAGLSGLVERIIDVGSDGVIDISKGSYFRLDMKKSMALQLKNEPSASDRPVYNFMLEILNGDKYALTWFDSISWTKGLLPSFENNKRCVFAFIVTDSIIGINVSKELDTKPRIRKEQNRNQ